MQEPRLATFKVARPLIDEFDITDFSESGHDFNSPVVVELHDDYGYLQMDVVEVRFFHNWLEYLVDEMPNLKDLAEEALIKVMNWYATNLNIFLNGNQSRDRL